MLLEIDHHSGVPIYRQVMRQIRQQIMTDGLRPGEQVEPVRELAARLKVNPMTISKAYAFLESEGLLERRRGVGLFVAEVDRDRQERIRSELLSQAMDKAAVTAIQLGLSEDEAVEFFRERYAEFTLKSERQR
ncbi:MAG TPA: GntR family transcriptional regulator [Anaerohalosphaeraceae bacterium]|jgi:GntR family transcriptional regulator|nr:GntR family transcriptional regulator [Anaerohalosphaeraceae bacterium]HRT50722.1 GntR family transcriptional regulator [Anaerohalosphaeraceae bacterium]HRT86926.1 GntR family transcriptional regulator [Anaerohalosphaeraceae bacterium]